MLRINIRPQRVNADNFSLPVNDRFIGWINPFVAEIIFKCSSVQKSSSVNVCNN